MKRLKLGKPKFLRCERKVSAHAVDVLSAYTADWDYEYSHPLQAFPEALEGASPQQCMDLLKQVDDLTAEQVQDAANFVIEDGSAIPNGP